MVLNFNTLIFNACIYIYIKQLIYISLYHISVYFYLFIIIEIKKLVYKVT